MLAGKVTYPSCVHLHLFENSFKRDEGKERKEPPEALLLPEALLVVHLCLGSKFHACNRSTVSGRSTVCELATNSKIQVADCAPPAAKVYLG